MSKVTHPGRHFAAALKERGITAYECAGALGIRPPRLYDLAKCKTSLTAPVALRLARYLGGSAEHWLVLQARFDIASAEKALKPVLQAIKPHAASSRAKSR